MKSAQEHFENIFYKASKHSKFRRTLKEVNIQQFTELRTEVLSIRDKKSKHPARIRLFLCELYDIIALRTIRDMQKDKQEVEVEDAQS